MVRHGAVWSRRERMKMNIKNVGAPRLVIVLARC
jgi:hypothetical protein